MEKKKRSFNSGGFMNKSIPVKGIDKKLKEYLDKDNICKAKERIKDAIGIYRAMTSGHKTESLEEQIERIDEIEKQIDDLNWQIKNYPKTASMFAYHQSSKNEGDWNELCKSTIKSLKLIKNYGYVAQRELKDMPKPYQTKPSKFPRDRLICVLSKIFDDYYTKRKSELKRTKKQLFINDILYLFRIEPVSQDSIDKIVRKKLA
ncbi:MAG: hypothetical protein ACPHLK_06515 [Gammaproteobacteria bacterium]